MAYTVVNDALPTGESGSFASFINASGEIAGGGINLTSDFANVAITWSTTGAATILPGDQNSNIYNVTGLNDAGDVIADGSFDGANQQALLWTAGARSPTILNDAGGFGTDLVEALNSAGDSIGQSYIGNGYEGVYWNASGASTVIGSGDNSYPRAINDIGDVGGFTSDGLGAGHGYATEWFNDSILWESPDDGSSISAINSIGAAVGVDGNNAVYWSPRGVETVLRVGTHKNPDRAIAINNSGNSIGSNATDTIAYEWSKTGKTVVLRKLPGIAAEVFPNAINDRDAVVGDEYDGSNNQYVAVRWSKTGKVMDLQTILGSGWSDTQATGINDAGDICGNGIYNGVGLAWELLWVPSSAPDGGYYVNAGSHSILHAPIVVGSVGHGAG